MINRSLAFLVHTILCIATFTTTSQQLPFYYPKMQGELIEHECYALDYSEEHEQASWVIYFADHYGSASRSDNFREDPLIKSGSAQIKDYKGTGYDRGHLAPAADMNETSTSMSESFFMSNMSPQLPGFNRGIWKSLETLVRAWGISAQSGQDMIITGPILLEKCETIGANVTVPCAYYKIYVDMQTNCAIGFIIRNESSSAPLSTFTVSIDDIENATGLDFFWQLEDTIEDDLESQLDLSNWKWDAKALKLSKDESEDETPTEASRCLGITKSGTQCKRNAGVSGFCWQHEK
ncbi:MAG: endonuclease G [Cyclobacteriaceae bacterium]|jgi:endonuclease G